MQPFWFHSGSEKATPTNLTLKNVPDEVYERLKHAASLHRRSLNSEAILCLEMALVPTSVPPAERLARARALRATLPKKKGSSGTRVGGIEGLIGLQPAWQRGLAAAQA